MIKDCDFGKETQNYNDLCWLITEGFFLTITYFYTIKALQQLIQLQPFLICYFFSMINHFVCKCIWI